MRYLNLLDYSVIGIYFLILLGMGIYFQRAASRSMEAYFLGGRRLPWWALGISGMGGIPGDAGDLRGVQFRKSVASGLRAGHSLSTHSNGRHGGAGRCRKT